MAFLSWLENFSMAALKLSKLTLLIIALSLHSAFLGGCASPEQQKKERLDKLTEFATQVTKDLLDRNPNTLRESTTRLRSQELSENTIAKLEKLEVIPSAGLDIPKEIAIAEDNKATNTVQVMAVTPVSDVEKDIVNFKVSGRNVTKIQGKPDIVRPFSFTISCKLTPAMSGYPQAVDVSGLAPADVSPLEKRVSKTADGKGSKRKSR